MTSDPAQVGRELSAEPAQVGRECCAYCWGLATGLDHVVPRSRGGSDDPANLVPACQSCDSSKGARTPWEWLEDGLMGAKRRPYPVGLAEVPAKFGSGRPEAPGVALGAMPEPKPAPTPASGRQRGPARPGTSPATPEAR